MCPSEGQPSVLNADERDRKNGASGKGISSFPTHIILTWNNYFRFRQITILLTSMVVSSLRYILIVDLVCIAYPLNPPNAALVTTVLTILLPFKYPFLVSFHLIKK